MTKTIDSSIANGNKAEILARPWLTFASSMAKPDQQIRRPLNDRAGTAKSLCRRGGAVEAVGHQSGCGTFGCGKQLAIIAAP